MSDDEFKSFPDITKLEQPVEVTEKIHGTNACILISEFDGLVTVQAGSRTRWITPEDDNFGFASWVYANKDALITALGLGYHPGEWYGAGINSGYGLSEKRFALFNTQWTEAKLAGKLPDRVDVVPVLYSGTFRDGVVTEVMAKLKAEGSKLAPGFTKPEGIVVRFIRAGFKLKNVFEAEETGWQGRSKDKPKLTAEEQALMDGRLEGARRYMQPIRLEKLLSRDEKYLATYPASLPQIVKDYVADLEKETPDLDQDAWQVARKNLFAWVKLQVSERGGK